jgi:Ca-activated chloride channel family protein
LTSLLKFSNSCSNQTLPVADQTHLLYILTEINPGNSISHSHLPLNFALVLDRSGSMAGEKLQTMKEAVNSIIDQLSSDDILSIITFESRVEILVSAQPLTNQKGTKNLINNIRDGGGTNIASALKIGLKQVTQHASEQRTSRVVVLTDGEATDREEDSFLVAEEAGAKGIPIIGLGFGKEWKEDFLFGLADRSIQANPGSHIGFAEYIPKPEDANKIFQDVYQSMQVVARETLFTMRMVQGLEPRRIWQVVPLIRDLGTANVEGRSVVINIGQLEKAGAAFLIEMILPPRPEGAVRIAQAELKFKTAEGDIQHLSEDIIVHYVQSMTPSDDKDQHVMDVLERVQAFRLQTQALVDAEAGDVGTATRKLRQAVTILLNQGENDLANQMELEALHLEQSGKVSSDGRKTIMLTSRKTVRLNE